MSRARILDVWEELHKGIQTPNLPKPKPPDLSNFAGVDLVAEFISPKKVYTFSSIGDSGIPKSVKHSASKSTC